MYYIIHLYFRPRIPGMNLIIEISNPFYGSAIFARPGLVIDSAAFSHTNNIEILTIETKKIYNYIDIQATEC